MINVCLMGALGDLFGANWRLDVRSPVDAIRAINAQVEGFANYLNSNQLYEIIVDDRGDDFSLESSIAESMTICPTIAGAGGAVGRILTGAALLGASLIFPGAILGISSATIGLFGASMILGGVVELLSEQKESNGESFLFDASGVSRAIQGAPVPILFGTRIISPIPISVLVENENVSVDFNP
jgi:predicted phage tail protein